MKSEEPQASVCQIFELTAAQQGLWFNFILWPDRCNNLAEALEIVGPLELERLQWALERMIEETDGLRTTFLETPDGPRQVVSGETNGDILHSAFPSLDDAWNWMRSDAVKPVDLRSRKLSTAALIKVAERHWLVYYRIPHILADGFAGMLFADRLLKYYARGDVRGEMDEPALLGHETLLSEDNSYRRSERIARDAEYWRSCLKCGISPQAPLPLASEHVGPTRAQLVVPGTLNTRLTNAAAGLGLSRSQLLTALTSAYFHRLLDVERFTFGMPVSGRIGRRLRRSFGMTSNIVLFTSRLLPEQCLIQYGAAFSKEFREVLRHQRYRMEDIRRDLSADPATSLFRITVNVEPFAPAQSLDGFSTEIHNLSNGLLADLDIFFFDRGTRTEIVAESAGLYRSDELEGHLARLIQLSANILERPDCPISSISILPPDERHQLIEGFNDTQADYPHDRLVQELFEEQAAARPEATAVICDNDALSYGDLNEQASRLAHHLLSLGLKPDQRVAICVERSMEMIVGLLAILKAGGAYVPLDPAYPAERLAYMLGDCEPAIILTHEPARAALGIALGLDQDVGAQDVAVPVLDLVADAHLWENAPDHAPDIRAAGMTSANLAYVIYTSGSTGKPKGVMVEHRAITNTITHLVRTYDITPADRLLSFCSISFDMSVEELFGALLAGASLCLRTDDWISNPGRFALLCEKFGITILNLPPSFWAELPVQCPATVRLIALGGEAAPRPVLLEWLAHNKAFPALFNAYGPAETAVNAAMTRLNPERAASNSIGRPIANTRIYILDGRGEPVPVGVAGELHIGGAGVARGYLNRPELTAERFVADPYAGVAGARMYRTGDLGRWLADGTIEYLGRNDFQVKIRGFRIELGEIENRLTALEGVAKAVVVAWQDDEKDDKRLVAYYTLADGAAELEAEKLRAHLAAALPDYMVPSAYVAMDAFPLTPNGKLDRRALPAPDASAYARQQYEAPQGYVEQVLADIWGELLGVKQIGRHDSFFDLGGHSLLAVRMIARLSEQGLALDVPQLFSHPMLKDLATQVTVSEGEAVAIPRADRDGPIGLSFAQQRLWFVAQLDG
ncbi:amino acid adenylation domain-containing protein, partial [Rhizobium johnstonii]|uniref:non-ribosomal peptide synthetase n=1 Tax=Rhizobium johnstonii TaxID=3019933 RepID=UPI003F962956